MKKERLVELIRDQLRDGLAQIDRAVRETRETVTNREVAADNPHEPLSMDASFLAEGQAKRARALELALEAYQSLSLEHFAATTPILLSALVTLEAKGERPRKIFIGPEAGGLQVEDEGTEVTVVTPASPLGRQLLTKVKGDIIELALEGKTQSFRISDVV